MNWPKKTRTHRNFIVLIIVGMFLVPILQQSIFAHHGKEIDLKFSDAQFLILPGKNIHQVKFTTTYFVSDSDTVGKQINGIMEISTDNGTLVKTTSIPNGFKAEKLDFSNSLPLCYLLPLKQLLLLCCSQI
jgi:hypothetical protein